MRSLVGTAFTPGTHLKRSLVAWWPPATSTMTPEIHTDSLEQEQGRRRYILWLYNSVDRKVRRAGEVRILGQEVTCDQGRVYDGRVQHPPDTVNAVAPSPPLCWPIISSAIPQCG